MSFHCNRINVKVFIVLQTEALVYNLEMSYPLYFSTQK